MHRVCVGADLGVWVWSVCMYVRMWASTCESLVCMDTSVSGCIVYKIHTYLLCVHVS